MSALVAASLILALFFIGATQVALAAGAQVFEVYDETQDGLEAATDPDRGNVQAVANPDGQSRLIIETHLQKAAPNCTYTVELVRDSAALNGGLDALGHTGFVQVLGTLTTNGSGNGNAHFDIDPSFDGTPDTAVFGHLDFEEHSGTCVERDGTSVAFNEYGGAPDPTLASPFTWLE
jgi:hypothetical protein